MSCTSTAAPTPPRWKVNAKGRFIDDFAPLPLVKVTANTGQKVVEAYCAPIPWLHVVKPAGKDQVVSASEGDLVDVLVPIPRVNPKTIAIVVDGVDLLAALGIDPAADFPNAARRRPSAAQPTSTGRWSTLAIWS